MMGHATTYGDDGPVQHKGPHWRQPTTAPGYELSEAKGYCGPPLTNANDGPALTNAAEEAARNRLGLRGEDEAARLEAENRRQLSDLSWLRTERGYLIERIRRLEVDNARLRAALAGETGGVS